MDFLYLADTSDTPPTKPLNPATGYPSNGDPVNGKAPTTLGAWIFYAWSEEFKNLLTTLGIVPDANNLHQLADYFTRYKAEIAAMLPGDMTDYATKMKDIDNKLSNLDLFKRTAESTYAKTADVDNKLGSYVTRSLLTTTLQPYAKTGDLSAYARTSDLTPYAKKEQLSSLASKGDVNEVLRKLNKKADESALDSKANRSDLASYAKTADVDSKLKGYATKADVEASVSQGDFIKANGNRGQIGGYSTQRVSEASQDYPNPFVVTVESSDNLYVYEGGSRTIKFVAGREDQVATKVVHVQTGSMSESIIKWEGCVWTSGEAPILGDAGKRALIVVARFSAGKVYASVFFNEADL